MYNTKIETLDYRGKIQILQSVFNEYNQAKEKLSEYTIYHSPLFIKESSIQENIYEHQLLHRLSQINHYREYIQYIDTFLQYLSESERLIIEHDFIKNSHKRWWESYFSSATYYRHKKKAIEQLIQMLFL